MADIERKFKTVNGKKIAIETNGVITPNGLRDIFLSAGSKINNITAFNELFDIFNERGYSYEDVWQIVNGATKMKIMCKKDQTRVTISFLELLKNVKNETNIYLYKLMGQVDSKFKQYINNDLFEMKKNDILNDAEYREERRKALKNLDSLIKEAWKTIKDTNDDMSINLESFTVSELEQLFEFACIYDSIIRHTPNKPFVDAEGGEYNRVADYIFRDRFLALTKKIIAESVRRGRSSTMRPSVSIAIDRFLTALEEVDEKYGKEEAFTKEEIAKMLYSAPSTIVRANTANFKGMRDVLYEYVKELVVRSENTPFNEAMKSIKVKDFFKKAPSMIVFNPTVMYQSTNFLLGKSLSEIYNEVRRDTDKERLASHFGDSLRIFPNLRITDIGLKDHLKMINDQTSMFYRTTFNALADFNIGLMNLIIKAFHPDEDVQKLTLDEKKRILEKDGIDYNTFYTGSNIAVLSRPDIRDNFEEVRGEYFINNIRLLREYVDDQTIIKILKRNVAVLFQLDGVLKGKIDEILAKYSDPTSKEFKSEFTLLVNDYFEITDLRHVSKGKNTKRVKKEKENVEKADHEWVDVGFNGDEEEVSKQVGLNDDDIYQIVHKELSNLSTLCDACKLDNETASSKIALREKDRWNEVKELLSENLEGVLAGKLARPLINYKNNLNPKVVVLNSIQTIESLINSVKSEDLRQSIKLELKAVINSVNELLNEKEANSFVSLVDVLEKESASFYSADRTHTESSNANAYVNALKEIDDAIAKLKKIGKKLIPTLSSIEELEKNKKLLLSAQNEDLVKVEEASQNYKKLRTRANTIESQIAEIKEAIDCFELVRVYFENVSKNLTQSDNEKALEAEKNAKKSKLQYEKPVATISGGEFGGELKDLEHDLGTRVFNLVKVNFRNKKAIKKLCNNMGYVYGDEMYLKVMRLREILLKIDSIEVGGTGDTTDLNNPIG